MGKNGNGKIVKAKVKEMVEGWEGRRLPKNISWKELMGKMAEERILTDMERRENDGQRANS